MNKIIFCGINLSGDLNNEGDEKVYDFKEIETNSDNGVSIFSTAIHELRWTVNKLLINSSLLEVKQRELIFKDVIKNICATNEICWILLVDGSLFFFDFVQSKLEKKALKEVVKKIVDITCCQQKLLCITISNQVYEISTESQKKIHEFPKHQKVKKIVSGAEHCIVLSTNGDVFSFGCGLRGALGHCDVNPQETPTQIEALAGLKIVDVAAGKFHSVAVSSFGDVYTWGWNTHGQLGLPKVAQHTFKKSSGTHQQVFAIPQLIELEDDEAIKNVFCGCKHTVLKTEQNRLLAAGLNNYGQLGLSSHVEDVDKFTEIPVKDVDDKTKIVCGYWSTYLINF